MSTRKRKAKNQQKKPANCFSDGRDCIPQRGGESFEMKPSACSAAKRGNFHYCGRSEITDNLPIKREQVQ